MNIKWEDMKHIDVTKREIIRHKINRIPAIEITSYEQLSQLQINSEVAIMHNCTMLMGRVYSKENDYISIHDDVAFISVYPRDFQGGNFMYELL